jgi:hypothetical protein
MKSSYLIESSKELLIDFSHEGEVAYWSAMLNVSPEKIKTAARACCSNAVSTLSMYLKNQKPDRRRLA